MHIYICVYIHVCVCIYIKKLNSGMLRDFIHDNFRVNMSSLLISNSLHL